MITTFFWFSLILISYTYLGYPLLIIWAAKTFPSPLKKEEKYLPAVSILIAAYNEQKNISAKIETCLSLDYPKEKLEILVGSDASTDGTEEIVRQYEAKGVKLFRLIERSGKVTVLNQLASQAQGEVLFFTDARQKLDPQSLKLLVAPLADPKIGSVSGELILVGEKAGSYGEGVGFYWKYEKAIRRSESKFASMLGATGAIYVLRRKLFVCAPSDTLLDDMYYPLQAVAQGYRAIFVEEAKAFDQVSTSPSGEMSRKIRTLAGNFQIFNHFRQLLLPSSPIAWQLISHKLLRLLVPYFLIILFFSCFWLPASTYKGFFYAQIVFYLLALLGYLGQKINLNLRLLNLPLTFCSLNIAALLGGIRYFSRQQQVTWK